MRVHEVGKPILEEIKHADLHCPEEVRHQEVAHDTGNISKDVESSMNMARQEYGIELFGVRIAEHLIYVVILPGVWLGMCDIISMFILWTLTPKTGMPLEMM